MFRKNRVQTDKKCQIDKRSRQPHEKQRRRDQAQQWNRLLDLYLQHVRTLHINHSLVQQKVSDHPYKTQYEDVYQKLGPVGVLRRNVLAQQRPERVAHPHACLYNSNVERDMVFDREAQNSKH